MTLHTATVDQLLEWHAAIVAELARRAQPAPPVARAPWEMAPPAMPVERMWVQPPPVPAPQPDPRDAELANLRAQLASIPAVRDAPTMLGGHNRPTIMPTHKTDPAYAARFAQVPARPDNAPPIQGNGKGEGAVELGVRGG